MLIRASKSLFAACAALVLSATAAISEPVEQTNATALWFENWGDLKNGSLTVTAADGQVHKVEAANGTPVFRLQGRGLADGVYSYELSAATSEMIKVVNQTNNGRGAAAKSEVNKPYMMNGSIVISRGTISNNAGAETE